MSLGGPPADIDPQELRKKKIVEEFIRDGTTKVAPQFRERVVKEVMDRFDVFIGQRSITTVEIRAFLKSGPYNRRSDGSKSSHRGYVLIRIPIEFSKFYGTCSLTGVPGIS